MTTDILAGNWKQFSGEVKKQWSKLTDDDLGQIKGEKDKLVGLLQEKYGYAKQKAQEELDFFLRSKEEEDDWRDEESK
ncbi:MAG TPA: CsbD family protein [Gammaproteobacteria bacterium]|nr:CsbD family protein [Gammaproteobacteria bacterium]